MKAFSRNKLLKVLSLNSASVAVSFVLGIISTSVISRFLGVPGMALLGSFRNFSGMLKSLATLGISNSVVKLVVENKEDQRELSVIYSTFFWVFLGVSVFFGGLTCFFSRTLSHWLFYTVDFYVPIRFMGLLLPLMVINTFWLAIYNGLEKFKRIVYIQIISNILVFAATVFLVLRKETEGGLLSLAVGELLMVLVTFMYVRRDNAYFRFSLQRLVNRKYLKIIRNFSVMALVSAVIAPLTLIAIRGIIVENHSINAAGIWDAINRLSGFYMLFFSSGLTMYYMPKLAALKSDEAFREELKVYFKTLVPLFLLLLAGIYISKSLILKLAFTPEFNPVKNILIWQLAGDLLRIMTLAFGFQILVKTMMKRYFVIEIVYNLSYLLLALYLVPQSATLGALQAYVCANALCLVLALWMFQPVLVKK